ncbi:LOW QUALITY PROTEIN: uncharacterized protein ACR2FA_004717 [Aphomia sociella]
MNDFMKNYILKVEQIKHNKDKLGKSINELSHRNSILESSIRIINTYGQIESSLQQLYDRLATLENAITFSHLNRLHPSIIDPSYLILELVSIQNEIDLNIPYSPNLRNIHLLKKKTITVKTYSTNETLNFVLKIPLTTTHPYYLLHLYSIPNNNNMILIPSNPYLILGSDEFAYPHEPCLKITDDESICKYTEWQALQHSEDCIAQLIQHQQPHNCTYATANYDKNIIQQIQENSWIVIMKQEEVIKTTCGDDVQYHHCVQPLHIQILVAAKIGATSRPAARCRSTLTTPAAALSTPLS